MPANSNKVSGPEFSVQPFRADGTFRLPLDMTPGRYRPRSAYHRPKLSENVIEALKRRELPDEKGWDRGRELALIGDELSDDYAVLYPKLGHEKARKLLDDALENGIDSVPDAPPELKALFAQVDHVPEWVDWDRVERGAATMRRYAPISWMFARLAFAQTYVNAHAGMPLYMTGSLGMETAARRLRETDRWRLGIQQPGALRRQGDGFKTIVRVRVLHSIVRYHLLMSGQWDCSKLGMPIPQLDMAGANLGMMMTHSYLLAVLGIFMTPSEIKDVIHFWRYHGYLVGTIDELNPKSEKDLARINTLIGVTMRGALDPRARVLTNSTMNVLLRTGTSAYGSLLDYVDIRVSHALYLVLNGPKVYDYMRLGTEKRWLWLLPTMFPGVFALDTLRRLVPGANSFLADYGRKYIDSIMEIDEVKNAPFRPYPHRNETRSNGAHPGGMMGRDPTTAAS
ncbi:MAG TPA: oxygenase MpaB family protein [Polyangiales bacterium]